MTTTTNWEARETARRADGKFGSYACDESKAQFALVYQRYEEGVGGDLMSYMATTARGMVNEKSQKLSSLVDEDDLAMETFEQLHKQIVKEASGLAPRTESPKKMIRTLMDRRTHVLADSRRHWGNHRAGTKLKERIEAFQGEHLRDPESNEKREMVNEVLAEVREETPASPAQEDFEVMNRLKFSSMNAPLSDETDSASMADMYHDADRNVEADPEDALLYGTMAKRAAVSSTVDLLTSTRIAERAEGAREALATLMPDHPTSATIPAGKRRNVARPVKQAGVRQALYSGIEGQENSAARAAFAPWPEADAEQKEEIAELLDEFSGGDDEKLTAMWEKCLDAAVVTENDKKD